MQAKLISALACLVIPSVASAQERPERAPRPETYEALIRCRALTDDNARLRCFDSASAAMEAAAERRDLVLVDRAQVRESRRRLFGLALPRLPIFGGGDDDDAEEAEVNSIESPVRSAHQFGYGRWSVTLEDGSTWVQVDNSPIASRPRRGDPVRVQRAALGTYMMRVDGQAGVRVRRQM